VTTLPCTPNLSSTIAAGVVINLGSDLFTVAAGGAASGASTIPVNSVTPAKVHLVGETLTPPTPVAHSSRIAYARNVLNDPNSYAANFTAAVAAQGVTSVSTDAVISSTVSAVWNALAGAAS
jgi:hypothetical protein